MCLRQFRPWWNAPKKLRWQCEEIYTLQTVLASLWLAMSNFSRTAVMQNILIYTLDSNLSCWIYNVITGINKKFPTAFHTCAWVRPLYYNPLLNQQLESCHEHNFARPTVSINFFAIKSLYCCHSELNRDSGNFNHM